MIALNLSRGETSLQVCLKGGGLLKESAARCIEGIGALDHEFVIVKPRLAFQASQVMAGLHAVLTFCLGASAHDDLLAVKFSTNIRRASARYIPCAETKLAKNRV